MYFYKNIKKMCLKKYIININLYVIFYIKKIKIKNIEYLNINYFLLF